MNQAHFSFDRVLQDPALILLFSKCTHDLEAFDRGVDEAFEFAMIGFDNVIQVFDLSLHCRRWAGAFLFQGGYSGALSVLITRGVPKRSSR